MSDFVVLREWAESCANTAGVRPKDWARFVSALMALQDHNLFHFKHSMRVGIYAYLLAEHEEQSDLKFPLFAGCGHDIGKCDIGNDVLDHPDFGPEEYKKIKEHPRAGFVALSDDNFLYTACIAGLHHAFQPNGYGISLTDLPDWMSDDAREQIYEMAHFIMLVDFFDALTTRGTRGGGDPKGIMLDRFGDQRERVDWLFAHQMKD